MHELEKGEQGTNGKVDHNSEYPERAHNMRKVSFGSSIFLHKQFVECDE